jgi:hypothetical protein
MLCAMKKRYKILLYTALPVFLAIILLNIRSYLGDGHIFIELQEKHLTETPAGFWLSMFEIDYSPGAERMKKQVMNKLESDGLLLDQYAQKGGLKDACIVYTRIWKYKGKSIKEEIYKGGIWNGPKIIPFQEYSNGGWTSWITIEFEDSIPYSKLLPDEYERINPKRRYEHTATIESKIDQGRRLFLFGYGDTCKHISLF